MEKDAIPNSNGAIPASYWPYSSISSMEEAEPFPHKRPVTKAGRFIAR